MRKSVVSLLLLFSFMFIFTSCGNKTLQETESADNKSSQKISDFVSAFEMNDTAKMESIFNENKEDSEFVTDASKYLLEQARNFAIHYADGSVSYDDVCIDMEVVSDVVYDCELMLRNEISTECQNAYDAISKLKASKNAFLSAEKKFAEGAFQEAYSLYNEVIEEDTENNVAAQEKKNAALSSYIDEVTEKIDEYKDNHDYLTARNIVINDEFLCTNANLSAADICIGTYVSFMGFALTEAAKEEYSLTEKLEILDEYFEFQSDMPISDEFVIENNTLTSVITYGELENKSRELIENLLIDFDAEIKMEAESFMNKGDYENAIRTTNAGIVFFDTHSPAISQYRNQYVPTYEKMIDTYSAYIPVSLFDLEYSWRETSVRIITDEYYAQDYGKDITGTTHSGTKIAYMDTVVASSDQDKIQYYINGLYNVLEGDIYCPYISSQCDFTWSSPGYCKIYGDDVLLYEQEITQNTRDVIHFSIDVTNVLNLKIQIHGAWNGNSKLCLNNFNLKKTIN